MGNWSALKETASRQKINEFQNCSSPLLYTTMSENFSPWRPWQQNEQQLQEMMPSSVKGANQTWFWCQELLLFLKPLHSACCLTPRPVVSAEDFNPWPPEMVSQDGFLPSLLSNPSSGWCCSEHAHLWWKKQTICRWVTVKAPGTKQHISVCSCTATAETPHQNLCAPAAFPFQSHCLPH